MAMTQEEMRYEIAKRIQYGYLWRAYEDGQNDGQYFFFASVQKAKEAFDDCGIKEKTYGIAKVDEDGEIVPDEVIGTTL